MQVKKQPLKLDMGKKKKAGHGTTDWLSKLGKGYIKAAYSHLLI